ncbi:hypothetical protein PNK_2287 [Candidatus Protochlamydia naegleriophila]|uniref:Uncharacterized protein n=1 Tax=Candidatus Protochlamydia naegleriophila TaxID=389348 RepID=A0A0U5JFJ1_9BACT|nr:hypothetical protein PNK_2287 [Candidatus Protochlamydia naegleriophila]
MYAVISLACIVFVEGICHFCLQNCNCQLIDSFKSLFYKYSIFLLKSELFVDRRMQLALRV